MMASVEVRTRHGLTFNVEVDLATDGSLLEAVMAKLPDGVRRGDVLSWIARTRSPSWRMWPRDVKVLASADLKAFDPLAAEVIRALSNGG